MANEQETTYLKRLKFDPNLFRGWVAKYLSNPRLILLIIFTIITLGVYSYITLPRSLNPEIKIPIVVVSTVLLGAGPKDVESLVTIPLEDSVQGIENIKTITSSSQDSVSVISIEFKSGVDPEKAKTDVKSAIDGVTTLPPNAKVPEVKKVDFENQPVWQFAITSKGDVTSLTRFAKNLQIKLENLSNIKKVTVSGLEEQEIQILIKPEAVSSYNLNPVTLSQAIKTAVSSFPAGTINSQSSSFSVTIDPSIINVTDIRNLRLNLNRQQVNLGDIAVVSQRSKPAQTESYLTIPSKAPTRAISFAVFRTKGINFDVAVRDAQKVVKQDLSNYQGQFELQNILNVSDQITQQFDELQRDFLITVLLVFGILFIFIGGRQASVALFASPLTFFITFFVMKITGITLSFLATFSLLLSLGLLVDDTIVVISAMNAYYRTGKFTPLQTALLVWRDFFVPIMTTTITTVWAFVPLLLSTGIIGEFIKPIPIIVSTTLLASFFVAMAITLPLLIIFLKPQVPKRVSILMRIIIFVVVIAGFVLIIPKTNLFLVELLIFLIWLLIFINTRDLIFARIHHLFKRPKKAQKDDHNYLEHGVFSFSRIDNLYKRLVNRILISPSNRRKTIIMVIIFSVFSYLLVPTGLVKNEFFPKSDVDLLFVNLELPSGTNLDTTKKESVALLNELKNTPETKFVTADLGQSFSPTMGASGGGSNNVLFTVTLTKHQQRHITSSEIANLLRTKMANYQAGKVSVIEESGGPPAGADLQIKLLGDDLTTLDQYAKKLEDFLKTQPGVTNIDQTVKSGTSKIAFAPDQNRLNQAGLTTDLVGLWLRTFASGFNGPKIRLPGDTKDTDSTIRLSSQTETVEQISSVNIPTTTGQVVPLVSLGKLSLEPNPTLITREAGKRTISVTAGVTSGHSVTDLNKKLENYAKTINLPPGYSWKTGGQNEENQNSVTSILQAMLLSFLLIITTMVVQFSSFRKALIVMLVIPLSISGVFIIFALTHTPLSFPALIGVLALFGIVVKNSILIVDKISANLKTGMGFVESIVDGSVSRLEAIALTSFATIAGLIPITLSDPLWRGLGGAIIAGLTFSGTIMLFFIPVVYYYWFRSEYQKPNLHK